MINIHELVRKEKEKGYSNEFAQAKICHDILLLLLSRSKYRNYVTIKGGVVISRISNNLRRTTVDVDLDLINFPLTNDTIKNIINSLNDIGDIKIIITKKIEDLNHQDYKGKKVYLSACDSFGNVVSSKLDIGVHKYTMINQENYCFNIEWTSDGVFLLVNSKEQMFVEKLKSLLRFGIFSTRYKDIYDLFFLLGFLNKSNLLKCIDILIFKDILMKENNLYEIVNRIENIFDNEDYRQKIYKSNKNWVNEDNDFVFDSILKYLKILTNNIP